MPGTLFGKSEKLFFFHDEMILSLGTAERRLQVEY